MQQLQVYPTYISVLPTPASKVRLAKLYTELADRYEIADIGYLHATVLFSQVCLTEREYKMAVRPQQRLQARVESVIQLGDWVVLKLESVDLEARFAEWTRLGLVSNYPDFIPHLSVLKGRLDDRLEHELTKRFENLEIEFYRERVVLGHKKD